LAPQSVKNVRPPLSFGSGETRVGRSTSSAFPKRITPPQSTAPVEPALINTSPSDLSALYATTKEESGLLFIALTGESSFVITSGASAIFIRRHSSPSVLSIMFLLPQRTKSTSNRFAASPHPFITSVGLSHPKQSIIILFIFTEEPPRNRKCLALRLSRKIRHWGNFRRLIFCNRIFDRLAHPSRRKLL